MKVAYLMPCYPAVSHSFIRREIRAVESLGISVCRVSIQAGEADCPDAADRIEATRTFYLKSKWMLRLPIAALRAAARVPARMVRAAVTAIRMGWRSSAGLVKHMAYLAEACVLLEHCRREQVDHVHAHFAMNTPTVALLCRMMGGPAYSFTAHGVQDCCGRDGGTLPYKVGGAAFVATVSNYCRSQIWRCSDLSQWRKLHLVKCGLDERFLGLAPTSVPCEPQLVCVARLDAFKGHMVLLEAVAALRRKGVRMALSLVGDGELRGQIVREISRLGLCDTVKLVGRADGAGVQEEIARSRALVLPSFMEGLPVVLTEAFAMGRPVIATWVAGIPELVEDGVNGWLVPPGSADALAQAMEQALSAPSERLTAMGMNGREKVVREHDVLMEARRLVNLFQQRWQGNGDEECGDAQSSVSAAGVAAGTCDAGRVGGS